MPPLVKLKFDANQEFQLQAVEAVTGLFVGYPKRSSAFQLSDEVIPNVSGNEAFDSSWLSDNLHAIQQARGLPAPGLAVESAMEVQGVSDGSWDYPSFTIEMETGTGKTYVYLRTIHELRLRCGWGKYVIVVPSLAIYEGVVKTFEITKAHFAAIYGNAQINLTRYDGAQLNRIRTYATSPFCEVLVMTLDSFNKSSNLFFKGSEKLPGELKPFQFVQQTRPVIILDEPQNMESSISRSAIATLHPLFTLRYSATHRTSPNLVYRLTPFAAFQKGLVKRIQVWGVTDTEDYNRPFLALKDITRTGGIRARVVTYVIAKGQTSEKEIVLRKGEDLYARTHRDEHRGGYVVSAIDVGSQRVTFENGLTIDKGLVLTPSRPELFRVQIEETIRRHLTTQERLRPLGIKVLSLFFIDRVANYVQKDGLIRVIFDEAFRKLRSGYPAWQSLEPADVRSAYFANRVTNEGEEAIDIDAEKGPRNEEQREAARRAFKLIMSDKEQLLSLDERVGFIFAHSALKEGWDNPNVFQICTLNQTKSQVRKRQEIGRGLRLCVNQAGDRIHDDEINILTVVANENYENYALQLQQEYLAEGEGDEAPPRPGNARQGPAQRNDTIVAAPEFREFWRRISQEIQYKLNVNTPELIKNCLGRLTYADWPAPRLTVNEGEYVVHRFTLTLTDVSREHASIRIDTVDTRNSKASLTLSYKSGDDLATLANNPRLRGYRLAEIVGGAEPRAVFENKITIYKGEPRSWESVEGQQVRKRVRDIAPSRQPIPDLLGRAAQGTGLTRTTINAIYRSLPERVKEALLRDPEGFCGLFISTIRSALADHIADRLECGVTGRTIDMALESLFPKEVRLAQRELVDSGERGLYDKVQKDSGVEDTFIARLRNDSNVVFFFKFPPRFVIHLPALIGNYNPDWGIVRRDDKGILTLHLVRETKSTTDLNRLHYPHEKRKIVCATKHFGAAAVDYRVVTDQTIRWWDSRPVESIQEDFHLD